jgi:hypothetical protein
MMSPKKASKTAKNACKKASNPILYNIKNPAKDFCWWDLDGVVVVVVVVVVQW